MVMMRGYILLESWRARDKATEFELEANKVITKCKRLFRSVLVEKHNAVIAIAFFDFSNHSDLSIQDLLALEREINASKLVGEAIIRITDDEKEEEQHRFEIGRI